MERKCFGDLNLVVSNVPIKYGYGQNHISSMISVLFKNLVQKNNRKKWTNYVNIVVSRSWHYEYLFCFF